MQGNAFRMLLTILTLLIAPAAMAFNVGTAKPTYTEGEPVVVNYKGFATETDWITIVKQGTASDKYGEWIYTKGNNWGAHTFKGLKPGSYEVRAYCCWQPGRPGHGGYNIKARHSFSVVNKSANAGEGDVCRNLKPGEPYYKKWSYCCDTAGNRSDWINRESGKTSNHNGSCNSWGIYGD